MAYIVDGNNLIGHSRDLRVRDQNSKREIVRRIAAFHRLRGAKVTIVFDGEAEPLVPDGLVLGGVKVIYSGHYSDADRKIKALVKSSKNPKELIVVSSDDEVYNYARTHGTKVMKSYEFNQKLSEILISKADEVKPTVGDLEEWYNYFGLDTEGENKK